MLRNHWYAVCTSAEVGREPLGLERLGGRLVLWRDDEGQLRAAPDRCPHKGARLSDGRVVEGRLACPYHGFQFDGEGACRHMPVHPERTPPAAMCLSTMPVRVAHGLVWIWHGEGEPTVEVPWFDELAEPSASAASSAMVFPVHYSRIIESNFDIYHFPFVHSSIDPGLGEEIVDFEMEADGGHIRTSGFTRNRRGRRTPFRVEFLPPNVQLLQLTEGVVGVIVSTPIDEARTWVWARYDQRWVTWGPVGRLVSKALLYVEWTFVQTRQDLPILTALSPGQASPTANVWVAADRGAARYVQWRHRQLLAQEPPCQDLAS